MSDPKSPADPPMEEILATVRRIIADDESGSSPPAAGAAPASGSDVLELTEALEADGSIRHIPPFGAALRGPGESRNSPLGDGRIEPAAPNLVGGPSERGGPRLRASEPNRESEPRATIGEASAPIEAPGREPTSPEAGASADQSPPTGASNQALENLLREMLRPMLQRWLDDNLPSMVEQAVRAEVARGAGDANAEGARTSGEAVPRRALRVRSKAKPEDD